MHAEAATGMPGIRRCWQDYRCTAAGTPALGPGSMRARRSLDSIAEDIARRLSPAYIGPVSQDEPKLLELTRGGTVWTRRRHSEGTMGTGLRLLTFLRLSPLADAQALLDPLGEPGRGDGALGREVFAALRGREAMQIVSVFDAVEARWSTDAEAAAA